MEKTHSKFTNEQLAPETPLSKSVGKLLRGVTLDLGPSSLVITKTLLLAYVQNSILGVDALRYNRTNRTATHHNTSTTTTTTATTTDNSDVNKISDPEGNSKTLGKILGVLIMGRILFELVKLIKHLLNSCFRYLFPPIDPEDPNPLTTPI